ncbi:MAG: riboflavin kinase [Elusimicrobiota bacterium]
MKIKKPDDSFSFPASSTVTIGEFDGFHPGHMKIIKKTIEISRRSATYPAALTFEKSYPSLYSHEEKLSMLEKLGFACTVVFNKFGSWNKWDPEYFIENFLIAKLKVENIIVGTDFRFGKNRTGSVQTLKKHENTGLKTHAIDLKKESGLKISASNIRAIVKEGKLAQCRKMLGRDYFFTGKIIKGKQVGRKLGFPTLNFSVPEEKLLPEGVFLCSGITDTDRNEKKLPGLCFIGRSLENAQRKVEVHFLKYNEKLFGKIKGARLLNKISEVKKVSSRAELVKKISSDIEKAKGLLNKYNLT